MGCTIFICGLPESAEGFFAVIPVTRCHQESLNL